MNDGGYLGHLSKLVAVAMVLAIAAAASAAPGFAGQPTTTTEPPTTTTTELPTTTTAAPGPASLAGRLGPDVGDGGVCTLGDDATVHGNAVAVCYEATNTGDVELMFAEGRSTLTIDGVEFGMFSPFEDLPQLAPGETGRHANSWVIAASLICEPGDTTAPVEHVRQVQVDATWEYVTEDGDPVTAQASDSWTWVSEGISCVTPVDEVPTFTG
jgi:hypothetical protein